MSYQVIARKWRPQDFGQIVGQNPISQTLLNALKSNRLPHALLFTGPRGTGKTSTARILAKTLRCPNVDNFVPCHTCSECLDISNSRSVDVSEIDGASHNGVDSIRELRESVGFMPSSGHKKVYIIDEVHMLSGSAFNALLKTLEEPPEHIIFILATTEVHKIPNTILSRCQRFDFRRIPIVEVVQHLKHICDTEQIQYEEEALWAIARQGEGSMRDSQSLLDQMITFADKDLSLQKTIEVLGLTDRHLLHNMLKAIITQSQQELLESLKKFHQSGNDPQIFIREWLEEIRHLLLIKVQNNSQENSQQIFDLPADSVNQLTPLVKDLSEEDIHLIYDMSLKGALDIQSSQDPNITLEMVLLRITLAPRIESLYNLPLSPPSPKEPNPANKPLEENKKKNQLPPLSPLNDKESLDDQWFQFVKAIASSSQVFAAKLENTYLLSFNEDELIVGVPEKLQFLLDQIDQNETKTTIHNYVEQAWKQKLNIRVKLVKPNSQLTPKQILNQLRQRKQQELIHKIENDKFIQTTQKIFPGKIVQIKELK